MSARDELQNMVAHLDDAVRARLDERQAHLELARLDWGRAFLLRKDFNAHARRLLGSLMTSLNHRTLEASTYSITGLRFVSSKLRDGVTTMTKEEEEDLHEHLLDCGLGSTMFSWVHDRLPEYDRDLPPNYVTDSLKRQQKEAEEWYRKREKERKARRRGELGELEE